MLLASCAGAAIVQATLTALVASRVSSVPVPVLASLAALGGALAAFAFPASSALLPSTDPEPIRAQATTLARLGANAALAVGSSLAGSSSVSPDPRGGSASMPRPSWRRVLCSRQFGCRPSTPRAPGANRSGVSSPTDAGVHQPPMALGGRGGVRRHRARATIVGAAVLTTLAVVAALAVRDVRDLPNTALARAASTAAILG